MSIMDYLFGSKDSDEKPKNATTQEDVIIEDWLDKKELSFMENVMSQEVGDSWPGAKDKLQSVVLGSISPFEGDLAKEMETMPEELRTQVVNRVYDLMKNPDFAMMGGVDIYTSMLKGGTNWRDMFSEIKKGIGISNFEHLASGDISSTEMWGKYDPVLLYRGQNPEEIPSTGTVSNTDALDMMSWYHNIYERLDIQPFTGDLPAMYLGISDPGEYWSESTDLPKDFTKFDKNKPVYDISNEIGINLEFESSTVENYRAIDHPEYGDSYFMKIKEGDASKVLNSLKELKSGKKKAISIGEKANKNTGLFKQLTLHTSLDLGHYTESLGYDKETNQYYISAVDIWDFNKNLGGGNYESWGNLSPSIEGLGEGIQMYGRVYISEEELLNNIIVAEGNKSVLGRLGQMEEN